MWYFLGLAVFKVPQKCLKSMKYHLKAYVPRIPKMWYFLGLAVFKVELLDLKVRSNSKKNPAKKKFKKNNTQLRYTSL